MYEYSYDEIYARINYLLRQAMDLAYKNNITIYVYTPETDGTMYGTPLDRDSTIISLSRDV